MFGVILSTGNAPIRKGATLSVGVLVSLIRTAFTGAFARINFTWLLEKLISRSLRRQFLD
jgi:hypothetical protein